jgi:predicted nucleic acid-binding protein
VLSWLLGEAAAEEVTAALGQAEQVVASDLTVLECGRSLLRAHVTGVLSELELARRRTTLEKSSYHWTLLKIDRDVLERARRRFPVEPIRTLDALHLASALIARSAVADLAVLSFDQRIRDNAAALGFDLLPA